MLGLASVLGPRLAHWAAVKKINKNHRVNFKLHQSLDTFHNWTGPKLRNNQFEGV